MYYYLRFDAGKMGHFPSGGRMVRGYDYSAPTSVKRIPWYGEIPFVPDLHSCKLKKRTFLTDVLCVTMLPSFGSGKMLASKNLLSLLQKTRSDEYQKFNATVKYRKELVNYYFLNFYNDQYAAINYNYSALRYKHGPFDEEYVTLNPIGSRTAYENLVLKLGGKISPYTNKLIKPRSSPINFTKICLDKVIADLDVFYIGECTKEIIISDRLKYAFDIHCITGLDYCPIDVTFR